MIRPRPQSLVFIPAAACAVAALLMLAPAIPSASAQASRPDHAGIDSRPPSAHPAWPGDDLAAGPGAVRLAPDRLLLTLTPSAARRARDDVRRSGGRLLRAPATSSELAAMFADASLASLEAEFPDAGTAIDDPRGVGMFFIAHLVPGSDPERSIATLRAAPGVRSVERIAIVPVSVVPNDSLYALAWHLDQPSDRDIDAPEAWSVTTGDTGTVIAIIDTGVLFSHPDLGGSTPGRLGNLWLNRAELGGLPGVDDDGNGYLDDVRGWDFVNLVDSAFVFVGEDWRDTDADPSDFAVHGTGVAGVAAALTGNALGVAGAAPDVRLMALRAGWSTTYAPTGVVDLSFAAQAVLYAVRHGATVINCSFASVRQADLEAALGVAHDAGVVVVVAAGNNGSSSWIPFAPSAISVAATDELDHVAPFSNRDESVDLSAPGFRLPTTTLVHVGSDSLSLRTPSYTTGATGTSFSAPLASAAVALVQSHWRAQLLRPLAPVDMEMRLRETADDIASANPGVSGYGSGRLNVARALSDPPTSYSFACGSATVGPVVVLEGQGTPQRLAFLTADGQLLVTTPAGDTLVRVTLPSLPASGMAAIRIGDDQTLLYFALADDRIAAYTDQGEPFPGWPVAAGTVSTGEDATPVLGDVDGDGIPNIVWGGNDGMLYAWYPSGDPLLNFPFVFSGGGATLRVAVAQLDSLPGVEIIVARSDGGLDVIGRDGTERPGWPVMLNGRPRAPIVVPDPSRPGSPPLIVVATAAGTAGYSATGIRLFAPTAFDDYEATADPASADLNGDGINEIVVAVAARPNTEGHHGGIQIYSPTGALGAYAGQSYPALGTPVITNGPGAAGPRLLWMGEGDANDRRLQVTNAAITTPGGFIAKSGSASRWLTVASVDADSGLEIIAGAGEDGRFFIYSDVAATGGHALWPTARANPARTGNPLYAPAFMVLDRSVPARIADLRVASTGSDAIELKWTAPLPNSSGVSISGYDLRYSMGPIDSSNVNAAERVATNLPLAAGSTETLRVTGLAEGATHYFAIRARNAWGDRAPISNVATGLLARIAPAAVLDLAVETAYDDNVVMRFTATGDDGRAGRPLRYELRAAHQPLTPANFGLATTLRVLTATVDAGGTERTLFSPLPPAAGWWVALRAEDEMGNTSPLSNVVEIPISAAWPAPVTGIEFPTATDSSLHVRWTATGDDGRLGQPSYYQLRASRGPIDETNFDDAALARDVVAQYPAGEIENNQFVGLTPAAGWTLAIRAVDDRGNRSSLPGTVSVPRGMAVPAPVLNLTASVGSDSTLQLRWTATGDDLRVGRPTHYEVRASNFPIDEAGYGFAPIRFVVPAQADALHSEQAGGPRVDPARRWWLVLKAVDDAGNTSAISNLASTLGAGSSFAGDTRVVPVAVPSRVPVAIQWSTNAPFAPNSVRVFDVAGRMVFERVVTGPGGVVVWDGRGREGESLAPGVYLAEIRHGTTTANHRLVLLR